MQSLKLNTLLAFILCCFLNLEHAWAQNQPGRIQGIIQDAEGKGLPAVSIKLKDSNQGTISNEKGEYLIEQIQPGNYTLVISSVGFATKEQAIKVESMQVSQIDFKLDENTMELSEVTVSSFQSPNETPVEIGKIGIKAMDLPQSVAIIDRKTLENQVVLRMSDVLANTNGIYIMGGTGGYQEEIAGRGFAFNSSNTFKNGVRYFSGMIPELSSVEKVEVMKGSAAILFGNVAAGGIINLVTKKPQFNFGGEVDFRTGSFGLIKPSFDVYGSVNKQKTMAFRINGSYEKANSFRNGVNSERFFVNPSLLIKLGKKTELLLEADYLNDRRTADFGAGIINYQLVDLPRERFVGVSWSYFKSQQASSTITLTHHLNANWKINATAAYRFYKTDLFSNTRPNSGTLIRQDGMWIRNIQRSEVNEDYYMGQVDLTGSFNLGKISNQFLFGADVEKFDNNTLAYNQLSNYDTLNIFGTVQYNTRTDIPTLSRNTMTYAPITRAGVYIQDLIGLGQYVKMLLGVRYSYQQTESNILTYKTGDFSKTANFDGAFSPRLGIVIQPNQHHSLFASYSNSFTLNTGVDITGKALPPSLIDQYEVGVKNQFLDNKISFNVTVYQINNSNLAQTSLANGNTNTNIKELAGSIQSKGIEVDIVARPIQGLALMAGYSFNETRYVKSNTYIEGSLLRYNPNHTGNLSASYTIEKGTLKGLQFGIIGLYFGNRFAGRSTRVQVNNDAYKLVELPDYLQLDATVAYTFKQFTLRAKMANISNVLSYNVHDDNSVNPIAPRNFTLNLCYKF